MAEKKWTPAQKNAVEAETGTVLVSAAAGSGKTSVLVERIVRKLTDTENAVAPESLLVVTFTNAAAQEMRSRIFSRISEKMAGEPEKRKEYVQLLSRLSEMQVCTMDSFCMKLVKENSHTLGIESDFRMLENGENSGLKKKAAALVLEHRFVEESDTFLPLAKIFDSGKNDARLTETVIKLSDFAKSEPYPELWLDEICQRFSETDAEKSIWGRYLSEKARNDLDFCVELSDIALKQLDEDEELAAKYYETFLSDNRLLREAAEKFQKTDWNGKTELFDTLLTCIINNKLKAAPRGYADNPTKLSAASKRDKIKKVLGKISEYMSITCEEHREDMYALQDVARELIMTVKEYDETLLAIKKEMSAFDFSDISHFALSLLCDSAASDGKTDLARELTEGYSEILIDEYQDTNRAQDALFSSVSKNGGNMFLVGDVKQSIYRFRLASPEIFIEKCNKYPYYDGYFEKSKIILGENFRSRKGILDCVNFVFSSLMSADCGEIDYTEDEQLNFPSVKSAKDTVDVKISVIETGNEKEASVEARYIADVIASCLKNNETVDSDTGGRKAVPSDFCILLRSPSGIAVKYINELKKRGIPVSSDVNQSFFESSEIKTVMSYLKVIDNPVRDIDLVAVMMSPLFGFSPDDVSVLRIKHGKDISVYGAVLKEAAAGNEKCRYLSERIGFYQRTAVCSTVDSLIRDIYHDTAYLCAAGAMADGELKQKNLRKLLEKAESATENFSGLSGFIRYMDMLRENGGDVPDAGGGNGVRIMSMHKSKGLEFPFVFIAGASRRFNRTDIYSDLIINHKMGLGIKRKEAEYIKKYDTLSSLALKMINDEELISEEMRIYYVALTRAKQRLYITVPLKNAVKNLLENEALISGMDRIHPYLVSHASNAQSWLIKCFLRHPDAKNIRVFGEAKRDAEGRADIEFIEQYPEREAVPDETVMTASDDGEVERIRQRASFLYKWADISSSLSKHTASSLDDEHFDPVGFGKSVPAFMFSGAMSPTDIGTATHRFLQFCDFEKCKISPEAECERLVKNGRLTQKQALAVDMEAITDFVNSDIMKRAKNSLAVFREKQFTMAKSICELDENISNRFSDEKTVIIGKIDLMFIENDGAVIVDYKTDNVKDVAVLEERYRSQMQLYSEAIKKSMDKEVRECILYSLKHKESISLKF